MDNSPAGDVPFARVPTTTSTVIRRRDTAHIDASLRPQDEDYRRFIHLVELYRGCNWDPKRMFDNAPFRVSDIGLNSMLLRAEHDRPMAQRFGSSAERDEISRRIETKRLGSQSLWAPKLGQLFSRNDITGDLLAVPTAACFFPPFGKAATTEQLDVMQATLERLGRSVKWLIPSLDPTHSAYEPRRYWRAPVWAVVNWMIGDGFRAAGRQIFEHTLALILTPGMDEYYEPDTGEGMVGTDYSWTAAVYLMLTSDPSPTR